MNLSICRHCEWQYTTFKPVQDISAQLLIVCDGSDNIIGYNKAYWRLNTYDFNLHIMEERYNIMKFENNIIKLEYLYG